MPREDHTYAKKKVSDIENFFEKVPLLGLQILDVLDYQSKYHLKTSARSLKLHNIYCYLKINETLYQDKEILDVLNGQSKYNLSVKSLKLHNIYGFLKINETFYHDEKKWTPLHFAAKSNNLELFKFVFDRAPDKNPYDNERNTPLHLAVQAGTLNSNICKHIIEKIYNINPKNNCGKTPLDLLQPAHSYEQHETDKLLKNY